MSHKQTVGGKKLSGNGEFFTPPLPSVEQVVEYLRSNTRPMSSSDIAHRFKYYNRLNIFSLLKRLHVSGLLAREEQNSKMYYSIPLDASGLASVYAKPLPAYHRSRVITCETRA